LTDREVNKDNFNTWFVSNYRERKEYSILLVKGMELVRKEASWRKYLWNLVLQDERT
jgi:hypothetical protein